MSNEILEAINRLDSKFEDHRKETKTDFGVVHKRLDEQKLDIKELRSFKDQHEGADKKEQQIVQARRWIVSTLIAFLGLLGATHAAAKIAEWWK